MDNQKRDVDWLDLSEYGCEIKIMESPNDEEAVCRLQIVDENRLLAKLSLDYDVADPEKVREKWFESLNENGFQAISAKADATYAQTYRYPQSKIRIANMRPVFPGISGNFIKKFNFDDVFYREPEPVVTLSTKGNQSDESKQKARIEDVGEKIGGARKDFAIRHMTINDMQSMNMAEKQKLIVKSNIWPSIDMQALKDRGVSPETAATIREIWVAIKPVPDLLPKRRNPADPARSKAELDEEDRQLRELSYKIYIENVSSFRDEIMSAQSVDDIINGLKKVFQSGNRTDIPGLMGESTNIYSPLRSPVGYIACYVAQSGEQGRIHYKISDKTRKKLWRCETDDQKWATLIKKRPTTDADTPENEEAKKKKEAIKEIRQPHLAHVQRHGQDWRQGADVTGADFMDTFGFRGVEFGNWLPQNERQDVLNMAYDSFCDLASAIKADRKSVSLGGNLAIAFGSRGKARAAAHFEPDRNVINLTRLNGAGSLAHEWIHALDYAVGQGHHHTSSGPASSLPMTALNTWLGTLSSKRAEIDQIYARSQKITEQQVKYALSWCRSNEQTRAKKEVIEDIIRTRLGAYYQESKDSLIKECLANPDDREALLRPKNRYNEKIQAVLVDIVDKISALTTKRTAFVNKNDFCGNLNYLMRHQDTLIIIDAIREMDNVFPDSFFSKENMVNTSFMLEALKLDKEAGPGKYWSSDVEMIARAGAACINDLIAAKGVRNDYLVFGSEDERYVGNPYGNPNPSGDERKHALTTFEIVLKDFRDRFDCDQSLTKDDAPDDNRTPTF